MGGSFIATLYPGDRDPAALADELTRSIRRTDLENVHDGEREDPSVIAGDELVYWRYYPGDGPEPFNRLAVDCDRVVTVQLNDTTMTGHARLFERLDGRFYQTDAYPDDRFGSGITDYFHFEYDMEVRTE